MRFLLRVLGFVALVGAVIAGTVDSIQSVSASHLVLTKFGDAWQDTSPSSLAAVRGFMQARLPAAVWQLAERWILDQPAFLVCLAAALGFWILGYRRRSAAGRFAA